MKLYFQSLGCDKTLVDSEHIMGSLSTGGFDVTEDIYEADVICINTCCFIHDALSESIDAVIEAGQAKRFDAKIVVFGCMAKRFYEDTLKELPEADIVIPTADVDKVIESIEKEFKMQLPKNKRFLTGPGFYSYLKIADGCNKHCTYCVIPGIRGDFKSIPMDELISEACDLANKGVKELMIVAQETCEYGVDLYGERCLHKLLRKLSKIDGIEWIRLLYAYPEDIYEELITEIRDNPKICHYIDMPIQHISDDVLKRMARRTTGDRIKDIINNIRSKIPDICLRTTLIAGFPGETEDDFNYMCDFVREASFDRLGVFCYSQEENTPAAGFENQIPDEIKEKRTAHLMKLQEEAAIKKAKGLEGKVLSCIVEGKLINEDIYQGRTYRDAPDIDGLIFINTDANLISGDIVDVLVTKANGYDLIGELYESAK